MGGLRTTFTYQNFSWRGDERWAATSRFTRHAPTVVFILCIISMILVALGSTWLTQMNHVTFPKIFQTLFIPGLSFFNTLPSLHAHLLIRRNPPMVAITLGISFVLMMLLSPILMLGSCVNSPSASASLRQAECYASTPGDGGDSGVALSIWALLIFFSFLSAIGYAIHTVMAWQVRKNLKWRKDQGIIEAPDPEEEERRKQKSHELWVKMSRLDAL